MSSREAQKRGKKHESAPKRKVAKAATSENGANTTSVATATSAASSAHASHSPQAGPASPSPRHRVALGPELLFNRELSWLDFNARVLAQASNQSTPLLERVKFLSIFSTNLDEFFMVRVAGLKEQLRSSETSSPGPGAAGMTAEEQLEAISKKTRELVAQQAKVWQKELMPALAAEGIEVVPRTDLDQDETKELKKYFQKQVFPVLTPLGIDPAHPFPHLPNKSLSLLVQLRSRRAALGSGVAAAASHAPSPSASSTNGSNGTAPAVDSRGKLLYAFVEVPQILPRFVPLKSHRGHSRFVLLRDVIGLFLPSLFSGAEVLDSYVIRITRDSDLDVDEDEAEDLLTTIEAELRQRQWGNVVRLEVSNRAPDTAIKFLREELGVEKRDVYQIEGPLNFGDFMSLWQLPGFERLKYQPFTPHIRQPWRHADGALYDLIRRKDVLVHHPYESFSPVVEFVEAAATDPNVLAIKMTLYRTSSESPIMRSLIKAAANGKQVVALVELKARFDEANNIQWARQLERGGVHVVYGIVGLKTHCKACLVVRRDDKSLHRYVHLGTGNYNPTTATFYTDLGLFTADPVMCEDVANLFNMMTGFAHHIEYSAIVPSPDQMPRRLLDLIERETEIARSGKPARIICKMNALVDPTLTAALYEASQAGVKIDLIVRGICALRPGIPGVSENIRVISIVGRFLEHTRIFHFGGAGEPITYLSSADWMQRNFYSRVEVMFPINDPDLRRRVIDEILNSVLADTANAWELKPEGHWKRRTPANNEPPFDSQSHFMRLEETLSAEPIV